ncbi:hypothetical protein COT47_01045 [Candidatus Woesearchaeota archaeon CG08_land_8_20_14_0_20_43_7]|nr:MAG: hypothetical protein COT47_01045 [Candidatus Woesearchaeota archaeon CG08_land_8_20_14_0_20_43_7]
MEYDKRKYNSTFQKYLRDHKISRSNASFKVKQFIDKAENSLLIARHHKDIMPNKDQPIKLHWNYWAITISYYSILYAAKAAILTRGFEVKDHMAAQIALGHLLIPNQLEVEYLNIMDEAYKIFTDEYVKYFEDARKDSHIARYSASRSYTEKRVDEIFSNARRFIQKIRLVIG